MPTTPAPESAGLAWMAVWIGVVAITSLVATWWIRRVREAERLHFEAETIARLRRIELTLQETKDAAAVARAAAEGAVWRLDRRNSSHD